MLLTQKLKAYCNTESGRSMIEMLGVLAIIGVLSIGSVAGYNYAVIKYKSTETMNELNQRSITYTTQVDDEYLEPGTILSNGEFGDKTALGYGVEAFITEFSGEFAIGLEGVPSDVCVDLLRNYTIPIEISVGGIVYDIDENNVSICGEETSGEMLFSFMDNLSDEMITECSWTGWIDSGKPNFLKTGGDTESVRGVCDGGEPVKISCRAAMFPSVPLSEIGQDLICDTEQGLVCYNTDQNPSVVTPVPYCLNYEINVYCCDKKKRNPDNAGNHYPEETEPEEEDMTCQTNTDCQEISADLYCHLNGIREDPDPDGVCKSTSTGIKKNIDGAGTYVRSSDRMHRQTAENYCQALNGSMVLVSDFGCGYTFDGESTSKGYCNAQNSETEELSDRMKQFRDAFQQGWYWTNNGYTVYLKTGYLTYDTKHPDAYALCRVGN